MALLGLLAPANNVLGAFLRTMMARLITRSEMQEIDSSERQNLATDRNTRGDEPVPANGDLNKSVYLERVIKFIPSEIIVLYLAILPYLNTAPPSLREQLSWGLFILCQVLTPLYLWFSTSDAPRKPLQVCTATVAFFVWAYSVGGPFAMSDLYHPFIAGPTLILFTFFAGSFNPQK